MEERRRRAVHVGSGHGKGCAGWLAGRGEEGGTHADPKLGSMPRVPTRKGAGPRATEHTEDRSHSWLLAAAAHAAVPKLGKGPGRRTERATARKRMLTSPVTTVVSE